MEKVQFYHLHPNPQANPGYGPVKVGSGYNILSQYIYIDVPLSCLSNLNFYSLLCEMLCFNIVNELIEFFHSINI